MDAHDLLRAAAECGSLIRSSDVSERTQPNTARTYLSDGTGIAWQVPHELTTYGRFVIDAEIVAAARGPLARRYGVSDPRTFAEAWTRAEALAKLADVPIITWLKHHRFEVPQRELSHAARGELSWRHDVIDESVEIVIHRAVRLKATAES